MARNFWVNALILKAMPHTQNGEHKSDFFYLKNVRRRVYNADIRQAGRHENQYSSIFIHIILILYLL